MPSTAAKLKETPKSAKPNKPLKAPKVVATVKEVEPPKAVATPIAKPVNKREHKPKFGHTQETSPVADAEVLMINEVITIETVEVAPVEETVALEPVVESTPEPVAELAPEVITTFSIDEFRGLMNSTLANSTCSAEMRKGMIVALETVLYKTGRFNGTRPLTMHEIPMGHRPAVNIDPTTGNVLENYAARDAGTDKTRVEYL